MQFGFTAEMDSMRLWDKKTGESLDKDVYRFNKGDVMATYDRVAARIIKTKSPASKKELPNKRKAKTAKKVK